MPLPLHWGLETLMLFYWICCVCSWCMWGAGLPKWINAITSSRWLRHLVPLPVIVLMLYWLLLSGEPNLHAVLLIPFSHIQTHTHTRTHHPPPHTFIFPALSHPWTHNPFFMALWNDYVTSWLDTPFIRSCRKGGEARWEAKSEVDVM